MSFPRSYSALRDMVLSALLEVKTCRDIVRRSGVRLTGGTAVGLPEIYGSFTLIDTDEPLGYTEDHSATSPRPFPGGFAYAMDRLADWGDFTEARLLATVTEAGETGATLEVTGTGVSFTGGLSVPLTTVGVEISDWKAATVTDEAAVTEWVLNNPSGATTPFGLGLCQLQVR